MTPFRQAETSRLLKLGVWEEVDGGAAHWLRQPRFPSPEGGIEEIQAGHRFETAEPILRGGYLQRRRTARTKPYLAASRLYGGA